MSNNITINTNQNPYFDDFDDDKNFHQVMYKPSLPVQARELTTQQSILRDQIKKFGDHVFKNGSKVNGADLVLNLEYEYVKIESYHNGVLVNIDDLIGKTITGSLSGTKALVLSTAAADTVTGDPATVFVKYITGDSVTDKVQGIVVNDGGSGYDNPFDVTITGSAEGSAVVKNGSVVEINITNKGSGYTTTTVPSVTFEQGEGSSAEATATIETKPTFLAGERISSTDLSISATIIPSRPASIHTIDIVSGGAGYTIAPTVMIAEAPAGGTTATASCTIDNGVVKTITIIQQGAGYDTEPTVTIDAAPAGGVTATAITTLTTPIGKGSSVSIDEGVFYIKGNFIKIPKQTLLLDKYFNDPSYKIGVTVAETVVNSGEDVSLLDNAQGSTNYAAPGADRLKISLSLTKKSLTSEDDTDFYEIMRVNKGIKEKDIKVPIYSTLENTFARRTYDESGSYTVRSYNIQLKDDPNDTTKFIVRLDPGKAFIEGYEHETIITTELKVDKAREFTSVNGFDRLMQYGNYVVIKEMNGLFDIKKNETVDLHNVVHSSVDETDPTTYASSKIGTARVRNIVYVSGTGVTQVNKLYLYDIKMSSLSFGSVESIVTSTDETTTPVVLTVKSNIDDMGKVGGLTNGDTKLFETSDNISVFKLPQNTLKTIRNGAGVTDTSYRYRTVFDAYFDANGDVSITSGGSTKKFFGTATTSSDVILQNYWAVTDAGTALTINSVNVEEPNNTTATINVSGGVNVDGYVIATLDVDSKYERVKTLDTTTLDISSPNTTALLTDTLNTSDIYKLKAVYDSESANDATLPTLTVTSAVGALLPGETITGLTSGATGTVVVGAANSVSVTYVPTSGTFVAEDITGATSGVTKVVSTVATGDTDITSRYELDNGQRDNFYDHGSIKLKAGETGPTGKIKVVFEYFTHSGTGYLSVDSYTATIGFENIPTYISPVTGESLSLRDCVDFRPRRDDGLNVNTISGGNVEMPVPNTNWQADYSYYLPRIDTIYLSRERKFGTNAGVSSLSTPEPARLDGTMNLYKLEIPAYTFKAKDITSKYIENKRYTMRDIGKLEKRISNLEYYTSLSLLEKDTDALVIKDATTGLDRFKNGMLVDGFNGHSVGNVLSRDYKCAIDFDEKILRPSFNSNITDVVYQSIDSTGVQKTGDCVTLPYTTTPIVNQTVASRAINVNPFAVLAWIGNIELDPPNDNWIDTTTQPEVIVNIQGENDAWESLVGLSFGTQFNDWQTLGTGRERVLASSSRRESGGGGVRDITTQTIEATVNQSRTGIRNEITGTDTVRNSIGDRIVDVSVVPFIRSRDLTISVNGMKPNTRVYAFFDSEAVSAHCTPSGGALGDAMYTDDSGSITGLKFNIPNSDTLRFRTGERQFLLADDENGNLISASTYGEVVYQAQGLLQTKENVVVSTRVPRVQQFGMGSATDFRTTTNTFNRTNVGGWFDPLAQTILVDEALYPDGIFLSDIDLFFKSKDDDDLPVTVQIRDTLNGYPSQTVLPFSDTFKLPADINVSNDASASTKFTFPSLVYLQPGEYAIVVLSNSLKYECWISNMGDNIVGTTRKVSEQPYAGVFFKSQNASTWSPDQNQDLTFVLNRAEFTIGQTANAIFKDGTSDTEIKADIIQLVPQEIKINNTAIAWGVKMTGAGASDVLDTNYSPVIQNTNYNLDTQKKIATTAASYDSRAQLISTSKYISPVIDTKRNSVITIENTINNLTTNETNAEGGDATARYITRRVNLKDGFDATDLSVHLTANRQSGSKISVYYKVLSQTDIATFDSRPWTLMSESTNTNSVSASEDEYLELKYSPTTANVEYTTNGVTYSDFKVFAIKIVMTSVSTTKVPLIKDLRAIALA